MIDWKERYMREVEGLNNEGDPIGGDPPSGLRQQVEALKAENEAQAKQIDEVKAAINEYYLALDTRQHGGVAQDRVFNKVQMALGMQWIQGASLAASKNGDSNEI